MQYLKRLKPMVSPVQNSTANTIYVDSDDNTIKVGTGASGTSERTLLTSEDPLTIDGPLLLGDGTASAPSYSFASFPNDGFFAPGNDEIGFVSGGVHTINYTGNLLQFRSDGSLNWSSSTNPRAASDVSLSRGAAGNLQQRNSTNAQRFDVANTYTSASNNELFSVDWQTQANVALVGTRTATTGTGRALRLVAQDSNGDGHVSVLNLNAPTLGLPFATFGLTTTTLTAGTSDATGGNWFVIGSGTSTATSGTAGRVAITPTYNQTSGTAANTDLLINRTETAVGSGAQNLFDAQVGGVSMFSVSNAGAVNTASSITTAAAIQLGSASGLGWGSRTTLKSPANAHITILNNAEDAGFRIKIPSDGQASFRLRDDSADATVIALRYKTVAGDVGYDRTAYGAGTAYALTNTAAAIDLGTTDPAIVLDQAGTYLISGQVNLAYNGATVVAETATIKVRRTNNTAADLSAVVVLDLPVSTTLTHTYGIFQIPPFLYTTTATDDAVTLFANVSAALGAGSIDATAIGTAITAVRLY